jgi:hypothetical protein
MSALSVVDGVMSYPGTRCVLALVSCATTSRIMFRVVRIRCASKLSLP